MAIAPFSIITYRFNPAFFQIGQTVNLLPSPGFSAVSYALSGTLPAGISFNTSTGAFTGTPTTLTAASTLVVTATLADSTITSCNVIITITDVPVTAVVANNDSAASLTNLKLLAEQRFLSDVEVMINNQNALGNFFAYFELPQYVSFNFAYFYLTKLNFIVQNLSPSQNNFEFVSEFGQFPSFPGEVTPGFENYNDFTQPHPLVISKPVRRIRVSWTPYAGYIPFPPFGF